MIATREVDSSAIPCDLEPWTVFSDKSQISRSRMNRLTTALRFISCIVFLLAELAWAGTTTEQGQAEARSWEARSFCTDGDPAAPATPPVAVPETTDLLQRRVLHNPGFYLARNFPPGQIRGRIVVELELDRSGHVVTMETTSIDDKTDRRKKIRKLIKRTVNKTKFAPPPAEYKGAFKFQCLLDENQIAKAKSIPIDENGYLYVEVSEKR